MSIAKLKKVYVTYGYDIEKGEFFHPDENSASCTDSAFMAVTSADGREWEFNTGHGTAVRVEIDLPIDQLADLASGGGGSASLFRALRAQEGT
jgi:hypothetical protein